MVLISINNVLFRLRFLRLKNVNFPDNLTSKLHWFGWECRRRKDDEFPYLMVLAVIDEIK